MNKKNDFDFLCNLFFKNLKRHYGYRNNYFFTDLFEIIFSYKNFDPSFIRNRWKHFLANTKNKYPINFYLHIPFCAKKCSYCISNSSQINSFKDLQGYVESIKNDLFFLKKTFEKVVFENFYFGGGTPSLLNAVQLNSILSCLFSLYRFNPEGERACELNPDTVTFEKLLILKKFMFNRVSFGVQSLKREALACNNRSYQSKTVVRKALKISKQIGFKNVNVDLIIGLYGDSPDGFIESLESVILCRPSSVCLYPFQPKLDYLKRHFNGKHNLFVCYYKKFLSEILPKVVTLCEKYDYQMPRISLKNLRTSTPWALLDKRAQLLSMRYSFDNKKNYSVLGFGPGAMSYIFQSLRYMNPYGEIGESNFKIKGIKIDKIKEMLFFILKNFSSETKLSRNQFIKIFGRDPLDVFKDTFSVLSQRRLIEISSDVITLKTEDLKKRFNAILHFFQKRDIILCMNRYLKNNKFMVKCNASFAIFSFEYTDPEKDYFAKSGIYALNLIKRFDSVVQNDELLNQVRRLFRVSCRYHYGKSIEELSYCFVADLNISN